MHSMATIIILYCIEYLKVAESKYQKTSSQEKKHFVTMYGDEY